MKHISVLIFFFLLTCSVAISQEKGLPVGFAPFEEELMETYNANLSLLKSGITAPPTSPVRSMAEWEEIQSLVITWTSYPAVLREIVRHAKEQCEVIIVCSNENSVRNYLANYGIDDNNVTFLEEPYNSVWVRDYGQNSIYINDVDTLALVDWIYNRPRPLDDVVPEAIANLKGIPLYTTTVAPNDLVHTGGNYMSDGQGTAFSSELVLEENGPNGGFNVTVKDEAMIDQIMFDYMGITRYPKMETLPYDGIHHIDMHMKLLDEETLLVGEYPPGVADGPQIEANIQYILSNFNSVFGTPYEVIRIQMPPDADGHYPDWGGGGWNAGDYRTYTNMVFVNELVLVPVYEQQYDDPAIQIIQDALPGYDVQGIDCNDIITALGAIHCITKSVGVNDPLLIVHQPLGDTNSSNDYEVNATIKHKDGIASATIYSRLNNGFFTTVPMTLTDPVEDIWTGFIPGQTEGNIQYYIHATATTGKEQVRPIVAPDGYWDFDVSQLTNIETPIIGELTMEAVYPNPASAITAIPVNSHKEFEGTIELVDVLGRNIANIHNGLIPEGESTYFINAANYPAGTYFIRLMTAFGSQTQKLIIR
ncbi:MAG: agmatine deiminase family protein [Bacteroidota bacterium]